MPTMSCHIIRIALRGSRFVAPQPALPRGEPSRATPVGRRAQAEWPQADAALPRPAGRRAKGARPPLPPHLRDLGDRARCSRARCPAPARTLLARHGAPLQLGLSLGASGGAPSPVGCHYSSAPSVSLTRLLQMALWGDYIQFAPRGLGLWPRRAHRIEYSCPTAGDSARGTEGRVPSGGQTPRCGQFESLVPQDEGRAHAQHTAARRHERVSEAVYLPIATART